MPQARLYGSPAERQAAYRRRQDAARREQLEARSLPPLPSLSTVPGRVRWTALMKQAQWALEQVVTEMEAYADARSDQWHESERSEEFMERLELVRELSMGVEDIDGELFPIGTKKSAKTT